MNHKTDTLFGKIAKRIQHLKSKGIENLKSVVESGIVSQACNTSYSRDEIRKFVVQS
jgi:hypothetical protein